MADDDFIYRTQEDGLVERCALSEAVFHGVFLKVRHDVVHLPNGAGTASREYIVHPGAVMVVPVLDDGRVVMERQYRYPIQQVLLEFPAGKLDPGESPRQCAERELQEETGYRATHWARAGLMHNAPAYATEIIEVWFAKGLTLGERCLDEGEFLEVGAVSVDMLDALVMSGHLTDAKSMVGLLWLHQWHRGAWHPDWQP